MHVLSGVRICLVPMIGLATRVFFGLKEVLKLMLFAAWYFHIITCSGQVLFLCLLKRGVYYNL